MSFRALMAIAAEFDLELDQMDAVNAFVNCPLEEEVVFMRMPPGLANQAEFFCSESPIRSTTIPFALATAPTRSLEELGFEKVPQEPCVMKKGAVIVFFYVDDIVWAYKKEDQGIAMEAMRGLQERYKMTLLGEPRWFLGIHILRDRTKKTIWLTQDAYIEKIAHKLLGPDRLSSKLPDTPMTTEELLPSTSRASEQEIHRYLQKVGSILFAAISTRPDIAFAVSRLARHNQNPNESHQKAADRVILYLYNTRSFEFA
ncbi:reverse transcriptase (RNA-dependent DNA polymerase) [Hirsutella rhossiliensis]|uniref:Reverse transcriptase (RNA-dependent DNA polymerase) domain-containing protein n=1 Tax=Hirsutella rhossiliensis TaxID=111463 RepID=A0A9P8MRF7_9HYPO|nr:reverse transcriptase (RNA-dependent DNA polymerase) domain-containing protein [Hirsutella rhossiliensis]KAH0960883.1 reverse transcriptase (RNA-dependent DNA polymerase) domain-containing protein [Hirsutella rhossiliensis]